MLFPLQTSYLVPRYNPIRRIQWSKCWWPWPKVKVKGQGQIFTKMDKKPQRTGLILEAISPTHFILGTKVQPSKAHSMTQVSMTLTLSQGQRSRSNFPQNALKNKELVISRRLFHLQTSYLVPRYNPIRCIQWPKCRWPWPKVKVKGQGQIFPKMHKKTKNWSYLRGYITYRLHISYQGTTQ